MQIVSKMCWYNKWKKTYGYIEWIYCFLSIFLFRNLFFLIEIPAH